MFSLSFLLYLLAIGGAVLLRLSYLGWFGPYFLAAVIAVPLFLLLFSLPSMLDMKVSLSVQPYIGKNRDGKLAILFETKKALPFCQVKLWIQVENRFAGEVYKERHVFRSLGAGRYSVPLHTELCGQLHCKVLRCECRDILGIFYIRKKTPRSVRCTVLPEIVPPDKPLDIEQALETRVNLKPKYGGGYSEEHDLREYRPGDTVNSIHWKLSSKTDAVIVREPLIQENNEIYLLLARVGVGDRGLELLYWLSLELCRMEIPHVIAANDLYPVTNEQETAQALAGILSAPIGEPCRFDGSKARCVFRISGGEVSTR